MNSQWKRLRVLMGIGGLAWSVLWAGCSGGSPNGNDKGNPSSPGTAAPRPVRARIALVMKSLANEFFLTMENGARQHQQAHSNEYELLANGIKDELDVARQIDLVE